MVLDFFLYSNINPFLKKKREKVCFSLRAICGDRKKEAGRLFLFFFSFLLWLWETKSPSLLLPALTAELKQEKQLLERLSHKALKSYQHDGWDWGTPMAPCIILAWGRFGNRLPISTNTWLSHPPAPPPPLPPAFPASAGPPTWFLVFVRPPSPKILLPFSLGVWPCWPLVERKEKGKTHTYTYAHRDAVVSSGHGGGAQSLGCAITLHCFQSESGWLLILEGGKIVDFASRRKK